MYSYLTTTFWIFTRENHRHKAPTLQRMTEKRITLQSYEPSSFHLHLVRTRPSTKLQIAVYSPDTSTPSFRRHKKLNPTIEKRITLLEKETLTTRIGDACNEILFKDLKDFSYYFPVLSKLILLKAYE
ncbi:hypothetical protein BD770DRAFT_425330 [Pilaira anomala]|nr:hypothetical protein BD770DRAFT_425330 [Pilaira anomala]